MANQKTWEESTTPNDIFIGYAKDLGLDVEKFKTDIASDTLKQKVVADFKAGTSAKVNSTPTFFINGVKIKNPTGDTNDAVLKGFRALLDAELAKAVPVQTSTTTAVSATSTK
jgi:protein-disulfide isomerase